MHNSYTCLLCVLCREDALTFVRSIDINQLGNPEWTPHLDKFHKVLLLGVIDQMARHCVPLEEDGVTQIAQELAEVRLVVLDYACCYSITMSCCCRL